MHLTYNDHVDAERVVGLLYLSAPQTHGPDTLVVGEQVGHLQVPKAVWDRFKAAWLAAGHTASWGFN